VTEILSGGREQSARGKFKTGLWTCWLSVLALPVGLLAIGGGPCAGPRNALGSTILLTVGAVGTGGGIFGIIRIFRGIKEVKGLALLAGAASAIVGGFVTLVGAVYLFIGFESLQVYLRY
jgi:hypothetical protein